MGSQTEQTLWSGPGTRHQVAESARTFGNRHLIIHTPSVEEKFTRELKNSLESNYGHQCFLIPFTSGLLTLEQIDNTILNQMSGTPETLIAMGGGTVIDAGKLLLHLISAQQLREPLSKILALNRQPYSASLPFYALPTTCGSGAEATCFATHYIGKIKHSLENQNLLPRFVALDYELIHRLPTPVRISCGLDALTQAIESYWSIKSTEESRMLASQSIAKIMENLPAAVNGDYHALSEVQRAAYLSGRSINITRTTLCHALSYPLTARYGIAHGIAVAASLPAIFKFNLECDQKSYRGLEPFNQHKQKMENLGQLLGSPSLNSAPSHLSEWIRKLGGVSKFTDFTEIGLQEVEHIITEALQSGRASNNPRHPERAEIMKYILGES